MGSTREILDHFRGLELRLKIFVNQLTNWLTCAGPVITTTQSDSLIPHGLIGVRKKADQAIVFPLLAHVYNQSLTIIDFISLSRWIFVNA